MSTSKDDKLEKAKRILDYDFINDNLLWDALSPPGAHGTTRTEGNSGLAGIGPHAMQLVMKIRSYNQNEPPGIANDKLSKATSGQALATVFHDSGLDDCLNPHPGAQGATAPKTAVSIVNALVGLVALQENGRLEKVTNVMQKLGIIEAGATDSPER